MPIRVKESFNCTHKYVPVVKLQSTNWVLQELNCKWRKWHSTHGSWNLVHVLTWILTKVFIWSVVMSSLSASAISVSASVIYLSVSLWPFLAKQLLKLMATLHFITFHFKGQEIKEWIYEVVNLVLVFQLTLFFACSRPPLWWQLFIP